MPHWNGSDLLEPYLPIKVFPLTGRSIPWFTHQFRKAENPQPLASSASCKCKDDDDDGYGFPRISVSVLRLRAVACTRTRTCKYTCIHTYTYTCTSSGKEWEREKGGGEESSGGKEDFGAARLKYFFGLMQEPCSGGAGRRGRFGNTRDPFLPP